MTYWVYFWLFALLGKSLSCPTPSATHEQLIFSRTQLAAIDENHEFAEYTEAVDQF